MSPSSRVAAWVGLLILAATPSISRAQNQSAPEPAPVDDRGVQQPQSSYPLVQEPPPQQQPQPSYPAPQPYPPPTYQQQPYPPPTANPQVVPPPPPGPMPYYESPPPTPIPSRPPVPEGAILDGHLREGPFLSGPGSLTFIAHHTLMGAVGGFATQAVASNFRFGDVGSRTSILAGTLIGAGLGFGTSAWWQFNHWIDWPMADYGVVNSVIAGMFSAALLGIFSNDPNVLTWGAFVGAELGGWLTAAIAGGEMPLNIGLALTSGAGWAAIYTALVMAIVNNSGTAISLRGATGALLVAPGIGAGLMAVALLRYHPSSSQILRADLFGAGVGGVVLLLSALVAGGFAAPAPYVLALLTSAGAIAAVSIFWEEAAEHPHAGLYRDPEKDRPYHSVWW